MRTSFAAFAIMGVCFVPILLVLAPQGERAFVFLIPIGGMILVAILCAPLPLQGLYWLGKQEKFFNFRFCEEVERYRINKLPYISGNWFLVAKKFKILAFRKDFIIRLENHKQYADYGYAKADITVVGADGKKRGVRGVEARVISDLQKWTALRAEKHR